MKLFLLSLKDFVPVPNYSVVNKINFSMPYKLHKAKVVLKKNKKIFWTEKDIEEVIQKLESVPGSSKVMLKSMDLINLHLDSDQRDEILI